MVPRLPSLEPSRAVPAQKCHASRAEQTWEAAVTRAARKPARHPRRPSGPLLCPDAVRDRHRALAEGHRSVAATRRQTIPSIRRRETDPPTMRLPRRSVAPVHHPQQAAAVVLPGIVGRVPSPAMRDAPKLRRPSGLPKPQAGEGLPAAFLPGTAILLPARQDPENPGARSWRVPVSFPHPVAALARCETASCCVRGHYPPACHEISVAALWPPSPWRPSGSSPRRAGDALGAVPDLYECPGCPPGVRRRWPGTNDDRGRASGPRRAILR